MTRLATDWWDALGHEINNGSYRNAIDYCERWKIAMHLDVLAREIRHDNPARAFTVTESIVGRSNQTAVYRLLATIVAPTNQDRVDDLLDLMEDLR